MPVSERASGCIQRAPSKPASSPSARTQTVSSSERLTAAVSSWSPVSLSRRSLGSTRRISSSIVPSMPSRTAGDELGIEHFLVPPIRKLSSRPTPQNFREYRCSRKPLSLAVALNCGIGSNSLNADVNALDRLQSVRALNSSYCGLK